ncbi:hypothetical protein D9Q98_004043 [Chlorella vulgaris]|uniref:Uncharacterized protein n=1 Tax=Chlorella vulgaris TaxID=3077 RepID=A0A9D4TR78_CHLVU|nr:hypothetical protein D9Q98_004043 [Chlorella vulgaris]
MLDHVIEKFVEYCSKDDTRKALEDKFLQPAIAYLGERFSWTVRAFHTLTVLVVVQTLLILWLVFKVSRLHVSDHFVLPWVVVFFVTLAPIVIVVGAIVALAIVGPIYLLGKALWDATADAEDRAKVSDDYNDDATTDTDSDIEAAVKYNG